MYLYTSLSKLAKWYWLNRRTVKNMQKKWLIDSATVEVWRKWKEINVYFPTMEMIKYLSHNLPELWKSTT